MAEKKSKALKELERGKDILKKREAMLELIEQDIAELEQELEKVNRKIESASDPAAETSREDYNKLVEAKTELQNSLMYERQREQKLAESNLITQLEYEKVTSELLAEANTKNSEIVEAMKEHLEALRELSAEAMKNRNETNEALHLWQVELYRNLDNKLVCANGNVIDGMNFKEFKKLSSATLWDRLAPLYECIEM